eukprot:CAMPEP_0197701328 /NCGR_PEP_ID=MMETSP1338-20131121/123061_1 /TAXON_ID=43686 ORGANISM="Pelagodinium beii, Strain RCC1491" /NCGR_SAMPLE_ID=MMETSP1338 /ASSEMBLY_ACC=CAM_ASM_000754 /LENGTH=471 /DNA_ID=CAMNT_0043285013 /DNA_START=225 /DNA_END=1640 /DNA_ORIENTATION=-
MPVTISRKEVLHRGYDCWKKCLGSGACDAFCGKGNACCRKGAAFDPPECANITDFWTDHHECVNTVVKVAVKHRGQDCWHRCETGGDCAWCGGGNACCRKNSTKDPPECQGIVEWPVESHHTCVLPVKKVEVKHEGQSCYNACRGSGQCHWCGEGNACCKYGDLYGPEECRAVVYYSSTKHHVCVKPSFQPLPTMPPRRTTPRPGTDCPEGQVLGKYGCKHEEAPQTITFYLYRAVAENDTAAENINGASLGGVLHYLHHEVVGTCPRKNNIDRIRRIKVTIKNTVELFTNHHGAQLGPYQEFVRAQCVSANCEQTWQDYGYVVGCRLQKGAGADDSLVDADYSLPGSCPLFPSGSKSEECQRAFPGGACASPTGEQNCTFSTVEAGEILIDELEGRDHSISLEDWCAAGKKEYDRSTDAGIGMSFWNGIDDPVQKKERMYKLGFLFWTHNKEFPKALDEPCYRFRLEDAD